MAKLWKEYRGAMIVSIAVHLLVLIGVIYATTRPDIQDLAERGTGDGSVSVALLSPPPPPASNPPAREPSKPKVIEEQPKPTKPVATPEPPKPEVKKKVEVVKVEATATPKPRPTATPKPEPTKAPKPDPTKAPEPAKTPVPKPTPVETKKPTGRVRTPNPRRTYPEVPDRSDRGRTTNTSKSDNRKPSTDSNSSKSKTVTSTRGTSKDPRALVGEAKNETGSIKGVGLPAYYARTALEALGRNFTVPPDRQRSIVAEVTCRILKDGTISNVRIRKSCGDSSLDQMAVAALEKTRKFLPFPDTFDKQFVDVEITFNFQQ